MTETVTTCCSAIMDSNILSVCPSIYKTYDEEGTIQWSRELHNGQILAVAAAHNPCSPDGFNIQGCAEKLKSFGIEIAEEECKAVIHNSIMDPQIRRYMFFSSRMFLIVIAVACYLTMWINIYSIVGMIPFGSPWVTSIFVSISAAAFTGAILLIIGWHDRKMDVNRDLRFAAVNENLMKYNLLVGVTDVVNDYKNILQLWFVYFNLQKCLQSLSDILDQIMKNKEVQLKQKLDQLCIVIENTIVPLNSERKTITTTEDSPLLSSTGTNRNGLSAFVDL